MTNLEAAKAKVADYCENPTFLQALRWLCAVREAEEMRSWATTKDWARLFMEGAPAYDELDVNGICDCLYSGIDPDDTEEEQQIFIEEIDQQIEEYCTAAREEEERQNAKRG